MQIHPRKTRFYNADRPKLITGVVVKNNKLHVRNKHHKAIFNGFLELDNCKDDSQLKKAQEELLGRLSAAGQISEIFTKRAKTYRTNSLN